MAYASGVALYAVLEFIVLVKRSAFGIDNGRGRWGGDSGRSPHSGAGTILCDTREALTRGTPAPHESESQWSWKARVAGALVLSLTFVPKFRVWVDRALHPISRHEPSGATGRHLVVCTNARRRGDTMTLAITDERQ